MFASKQFSGPLIITLQLLPPLALIKNMQRLLQFIGIYQHSRGDGSKVKVGRNANGCKYNAEVGCKD